MLFQRLEQRLDRAVEVVSEADQVGRAPDRDFLVAAVVGDCFGEARARIAATTGLVLGVEVVGEGGDPAAASASRRPTTAVLRRARNSPSTSSPIACGRSITRCSTRPALVMSTRSNRCWREGDDLDVPHGRPSEGRVLDDGDLLGQLGQQPHAAVNDVVQVDRPWRNVPIARRSAGVSGLTLVKRSTKSR